MNNNYVIKTDNNQYFGGWKRGLIQMLDTSDKKYAERMSRTVAMRQIGKVEEFTKRVCQIECV